MKVIKHKGNWGLLFTDEEIHNFRLYVIDNFDTIPRLLKENGSAGDEAQSILSKFMRKVSNAMDEAEDKAESYKRED